MNEKQQEKSNPGGLFKGEQSEKSVTEKATTKSTVEEKPKAQGEKPEPPKEKEKAQSSAVADKKAAPAVTMNAINKLPIARLVKEQPKAKFIAALVGTAPDKAKYQEAEMQFNKEASFALQAFSNNDYLTKVAENDKISVINAIINVAQTGLTLNPVLKLGYLIPMDKKVQFWPSYMGKREIVMRTGLVKDAYARLVYDGDQFEIKYGTGGYIKHTPDPWKEQKLENVKGGYWYCMLKDGTEKFGTMNESEIKAIQKRSPSAKASQSPWTTDWEQMALKTIFNRGFKEMPKGDMSEAQLRALEIADKPEEDTMKKWLKTIETKQDRFDDDEAEDVDVVDVEEA